MEYQRRYHPASSVSVSYYRPPVEQQHVETVYYTPDYTPTATYYADNSSVPRALWSARHPDATPNEYVQEYNYPRTYYYERSSAHNTPELSVTRGDHERITTTERYRTPYNDEDEPGVIALPYYDSRPRARSGPDPTTQPPPHSRAHYTSALLDD